MKNTNKARRAAMMPATTRLLSLATAADQLGISHWTLRAWARTGRIATVKAGARVLVPESELGRIMSEGYRPAVSGGGK